MSSGQVPRGDVLLAALDPTLGRQVRKSRPCVIVSPDELNGALNTFIVAPLTRASHSYPFRISCRFAGRPGHIVLDQLRTVYRVRLTRKIGRIAPSALDHVLGVLQEMFAA